MAYGRRLVAFVKRLKSKRSSITSTARDEYDDLVFSLPQRYYRQGVSSEVGEDAENINNNSNDNDDATNQLSCARDADTAVTDLDVAFTERNRLQAEDDKLQATCNCLREERDKVVSEWKHRGLKLYEADVKISSLQSNLTKCSEKLPQQKSSRIMQKRLKRRETKLDKTQREIEGLTLQNRNLVEVKDHLEAKLHDLSEKLEKVNVEKRRDGKSRSYHK